MIKIIIYLESVIYQQDVAILLSFLKGKGVECRVVFNEIEKGNIFDTICDYDPMYIILATELRGHGGSGEIKKILISGKEIKEKTRKPIILFGRHATIAGKIFLEKFPYIDFLVVGDPEYPIADLLLKGIKEEVPGLVYFDNEGNVRENPVGTQTDLGSLPIPDFDEFFNIKGADRLGFFLNISRGCSYSCTFCQNSKMARITETKGVSPRFFPVGWVIESILYLKKKYGPIANFYFTDTNFTISKEYLRKLMKSYKDKVNVPFVCGTRANQVDEEVAQLLKEGNCSKVNIGVEAGDETVRNTLLKKALPDKHIIRCVSALHKYKIRIAAGIILGLPGETLDSAMESLKKARAFGFDIIQVALFQPYVGTPLSEFAIENGFLSDDFTLWEGSASKILGKSPLNMLEVRKIENLQLLSPLFRVFPNKTIFSIICSLPNNRFFLLVYHLPRVIRSVKYEYARDPFIKKMKCFFLEVFSIIYKKERGYNR